MAENVEDVCVTFMAENEKEHISVTNHLADVIQLLLFSRLENTNIMK